MRLDSLTNGQVKVLFVALVLIVLTGLVPPWERGPRGTDTISIGAEAARYAPIFMPPDSTTIDLKRLLVTWVVIAAGAGVMLILTSGRLR